MAATKRKKETNGAAAAEQLSEPTDAAPIDQEQSEPEFFRRLLQLPTENWQNGHTVYCYRTWPVIDKRDQEHFLCKVSEPFDADYLLRNFGSGKYYLQLNNRRGEKLASKTLSLHNPDFPPRVDPKEVVASDPRNKVYFDVWKPAPAPPPAPAPAATGESAAVEELAKLAGKVLEQKTVGPAPNALSEATTTLILDMARGRDELAEKLAGRPSNDAHVDPIKALREAVELIRTVQPTVQPTAAPVDPISQLKGLLEMLKQTKELLGVPENDGGNLAAVATTRGSKMSGWQEMIQPAIPVALDFLKPFAAGLAQNLFARAGQPTPAVNGTAPPAQSPATPQAQPQNGAMPPLLNMIAPAMLNYMRVEADPQELGEDFASWVHEGYQADPRFNSAIGMARAGGPNVIIAQFKGSPWWMDKGANHDQPSLAEMEGKFGMFVQAFLNWQPGAQAEDPNAAEVIDIG